MTPPRGFTPVAADAGREMPAGLTARLDAIRTALEVLEDEGRRFERLGFERPLARCHESARYWRFLGALYETAARERETAPAGPWGGR